MDLDAVTFVNMRWPLAITLVLAAAWLAAADFPVPIYSHHGKVSPSRAPAPSTPLKLTSLYTAL